MREIAGGDGGEMGIVKATSALNYLGSLGEIAIVDNNNILFVYWKYNEKMQ